MSTVESKAKFNQTIDDRTTPTDDTGKIQTGSDLGTTKRAADTRNLILNPEQKVVIPTPLTAISSLMVVGVATIPNFFKRNGGAVDVSRVIMNIREAAGVAAIFPCRIDLFNEPLTGTYTPSVVVNIPQADADNRVASFNLTSGGAKIDLAATRAFFSLDKMGMELPAGTTDLSLRIVVIALGSATFVGTSGIYLKIFGEQL